MKIALITDTHFGARKANIVFHEYFKKFYDDIFFPTIKERNIKNVIHLGDSFDNRKNVDFWALDWAKEVVYDRLAQYNTKVYTIVGNHDVYFKNTNEINAIDSLLTSYSNIKHYSSATEVDIDGFKTLLMPWICQDNYKESMNTIKNSKLKVAFGHLELNGFSLFPGIVQTNAFMGLNPSYFQHFDVVFSGHYHTRSNDGKIYSWEVESGKPSAFIEIGDDSINLIDLKENKFSLVNGNKWLKGLHNEHVWIMDRMIGNIDDPKTIIDRVNALGFSPDGKLLATGGGVPSRSGELKVWNVNTSELVSSNVDSHSDTISGLVFSPSGQSIATSATDRFVKVFKVNGGDLEKSFEGHTNHVLDVTWSADGFLLASAGADNVVKIWDYEKGTQKETVKGHSKAVGSIDYLGLTGTLLSSSGDKSVRLSNKPLPGSDTFIHVSGASHDGSHIAAGGEDSVLRIWTASDSKLILKLQ